ncbi:MAG: sugar-binding domain-containing protein, partial [Chthoniobacterales bacterium]
MKKLILPFLFLATIVAAPAENIPDLYLQPSTSLDGDWRIIIDPYELGYYDYRLQPRDESATPSLGESFFLDTKPVLPSDRIEYDWDKSATLKVPGDWNTQKPELLYYEGTLWYRRLFDTPQVKAGERTFLRFGAANYRADVYLNGKKLGTHI